MRSGAAAFGVFLILMLIAAVPSHAWLYYHKPAFKGKIFDAETNAPLEGVAVVAIYQKTIAAGFEPITQTIEVRETFTDKDGIFYIPSYTTIIDPFSINSYVRFIFNKPGYMDEFRPGNFSSDAGISGDEHERFFSESFGKEDNVLLDPNMGKIGSTEKYYKVVFGVIKLPRLKTRTRGEILRETAVVIDEKYRYKTPILNKYLLEEESQLPKK
ncbi:MAG TPA: hypothetical protein VGK27_02170 [Candidatus Deferrimicrobiaceae bacterium]|jgi:hypothetical protein